MNYLHRLLRAEATQETPPETKDEARKAFVLQYSQIREEAQESGAKIFFVDEAHFRADADLRGKWVLKGQPGGLHQSPVGREGLPTREFVWRLGRWKPWK